MTDYIDQLELIAFCRSREKEAALSLETCNAAVARKIKAVEERDEARRQRDELADKVAAVVNSVRLVASACPAKLRPGMDAIDYELSAALAAIDKVKP